MHVMYLRAGLESLHEIHRPAFSPQWQWTVGVYSSGRSLYGIGEVEAPKTVLTEGAVHAADLELPPVANELELPKLAMAQPPARGKSARGELGRGLCRLLVGEDSRRERDAAGGRYLGSRPATKLRTLVAAGHQTLAAAERESERERESESEREGERATECEGDRVRAYDKTEATRCLVCEADSAPAWMPRRPKPPSSARRDRICPVCKV